jgi:enoyl-CoA hydratase/carnithine racemase
MTNHILSIRHCAVLEARLNRPEKKNALTGAMYDGIAEILEQASSMRFGGRSAVQKRGKHLPPSLRNVSRF